MAQVLINLQANDYEHPFDKVALEKVKKIPAIPAALNYILNWTYVKWQIVGLCGSNYHVTKESCPELFSLAHDVEERLALDRFPELYIQQEYTINAYTTGHKKDAFIVVMSGAVDRLNDKELQFVIGHEAGHYKSGHVLYHLLGAYLGLLIPDIPFLGDTATAPLNYWNRMSEFTADRAGLLACQDLNAALSAIMKMSGLPERFYESASIDGFMKQAREFSERYGGTADEIIKTVTMLQSNHPWTIMRAGELIKWVESGEYERILKANKGKECKICGKTCPVDMEFCPICGGKSFES